MIHKGYTFKSRVYDVGAFRADWSQDVIKNEPMLFNCDAEFARKKGGPLTEAFLNALPYSWWNAPMIIDSRVHMLMPGWYACIPGYHHDDVARDGSGQPNYERQPYYSRHVMGLVNAEIAPTVFATGDHDLPKIENGVVYGSWDPLVRGQIADGKLQTVEAKSGRVYEFDWQTIHSGQKATGRGWRWFIRATERKHNWTNEIRNQVNVYLDMPMAGW